MLSRKTHNLSIDLVQQKAEGIAWAVRSALGYWERSLVALNARLLSRYYAVMQIALAERVASLMDGVTLKDVQRDTEFGGHGLMTITAFGGPSPENYMLGCMKNGLFRNYCRSRGFGLENVIQSARKKKWDDVTPNHRAKLVSLGDLLARVPELRDIVYECLQR